MNYNRNNKNSLKNSNKKGVKYSSNPVERFSPDINFGLSNEQIKSRIEDNLVNYDTSVPTKSFKQIIFDNFFTLFNIMNVILAALVFLVGSYKNMLFFFIVIINTAISTIQEIHSKKVVDKLSIIAQSKSKVIRNGKKENISMNELVLDDIIELSNGNQIITDCIIQKGEVLVNESYITGEPNSITKKTGDMILSGSFIVSGKCVAKVEHIAEDNYTCKISNSAKYVKKVNSEIMNSLKKIIKFLTFAIMPIGLSLFASQYYFQAIPFKDAIVQTVAAVIGMIPEGLVLLTSTVLAVSIIRLSKSRVLVQDLYCIETLARVDTLCLDKTGTLTTGKLEVKDLISFDNTSKEELKNILANISNFSEDENETILSIKNKYNKISQEFIPTNIISFSSDKKWSGIHFKDNGSYIIGAPNFILDHSDENIKTLINNYSKDYRVLLIAHSTNDFDNKNLPATIEPLGLILILDTIRKNAKQTLNYFKKQKVDIKIISGDNPITVSQIAKHIGVDNYNKYIDLSTLDQSVDFKDIVNEYTIFGRVSPTQKKSLVNALQQNGKTVAMTGDGVNDVLALKEADCSIAMANGSDATKNISQLVLLNSDFSSMPKVVAEGRRTINNIERSASLFLVKTIYSLLLALMVLLMKDEYPFIPIQLSLIGVLTIGIPSFMLALEPNKERICGNFLKNIIKRALPTGLLVVVMIFILNILCKLNIISENKLSSYCVLSTGMCGLGLLFTFIKSRKSEETKLPFSIYRLTLAIVMASLFVLVITYFGNFFNICL